MYIGKQANTHSVPAMVEGWLSGPVNAKYLGDRVLLYATVYTYPYRTTRLITRPQKKCCESRAAVKKGAALLHPTISRRWRLAPPSTERSSHPAKYILDPTQIFSSVFARNLAHGDCAFTRVRVQTVYVIFFGRIRLLYQWAEVSPNRTCLLYTSPSPRDQRGSRMPSSA